MEKFSSIDRVVGNISEEGKEKIFQDRREMFNDQAFEFLKGKEREKTQEELVIIALVNEATNGILHKYNLKDFNIPKENIHIITKKEWPERYKTTRAFFSQNWQGIAMCEDVSKIYFAVTIFHEMLHFKSYGALQITSSDDSELANYRQGLIVHTRDGKDKYFVNLDEAVTEEITKSFIKDVLDDVFYEQETEQTKKVISEFPNIKGDSGQDFFDDDTFYAEIRGGRPWLKVISPFWRNLFNLNRRVFAHSFTYKPERKILNILIDKMFERNLDEFKDREEVFELFAKGMMTGNILPVGRLIENTFGKGTLRKIGELDADIEAQEKFIDGL